VALTTAILGGAVLSHRITESELEREVLDATPDLAQSTSIRRSGFDAAAMAA